MNASNLPAWVIPFILIAFLATAVGLVIFYVRIFRTLRAGMQRDDDGNLHVPLLRASIGVKSLPRYLSFFGNNFNPRLTFTKNSVIYQIWSTTRMPYSQIEEVDIAIFGYVKNLILKFYDSPFTFVGNVYTKQNLRDALTHLKKIGAPLTDSADEFRLQIDDV